MSAERRAWTVHDGREHYFDGTFFWVTETGRTLAIRPEEAPQTGWRHRSHCACSLCCRTGMSGEAAEPDDPLAATPGTEPRPRPEWRRA